MHNLRVALANHREVAVVVTCSYQYLDVLPSNAAFLLPRWEQDSNPIHGLHFQFQFPFQILPPTV